VEQNLANTQNISQIILETINYLFSTLFSSVDNQAYSALDNLAFIDVNILKDSFFYKIFGTSSTNGLLLVANSLLIAFALYYCFHLLYANFSSTQIERPYQFIFKLLIFGIVINCSYFICEQFIYIISLISSSIREIGKSIFNENISFSSLIQNLDSIISIEESGFNIFSFDGLIKSFISICLFNLLFSYAFRYIMIKLFVLLAPFSFLSLINISTSFFFKTWFRALFTLLIMQCFISVVLLIIFSLDINSTSLFSKLIYIGSIYALSRLNTYIKELFGGVSTDISNNLGLMRTFLKSG